MLDHEPRGLAVAVTELLLGILQATTANKEIFETAKAMQMTWSISAERTS